MTGLGPTPAPANGSIGVLAVGDMDLTPPHSPVAMLEPPQAMKVVHVPGKIEAFSPLISLAPPPCQHPETHAAEAPYQSADHEAEYHGNIPAGRWHPDQHDQPGNDAQHGNAQGDPGNRLGESFSYRFA
jgi:hypothetical protein